jgi:hypothetical protein
MGPIEKFANEIADTIRKGLEHHDAAAQSKEALGAMVDKLAELPGGGGKTGAMLAAAYQVAHFDPEPDAAYQAFLGIANKLLDIVTAALKGIYEILGDEISVPTKELPAEVKEAARSGRIEIKAVAPSGTPPAGAFVIAAVIVVSVASLAVVLYEYFSSVKEKYETQKAQIDTARLGAVQYAIDHGESDVAKLLAGQHLGEDSGGAGAVAPWVALGVAAAAGLGFLVWWKSR